MHIMTDSWFWFSAGSTVSGIMALALTHLTLELKVKRLVAWLSWAAASIAYFFFVYFGMVFTDPNWYSYYVFFGWMVFLMPPALLMYKEQFSTKLFTVTSGVFLANVTTFISGGITTSNFAYNPYDQAVGYLWSIPFTIIKLIVSVVTVTLYVIFARKLVKEVFQIMEGKMTRFGPIPFVASIGFFIIAQIAGVYNIMPNAGLDFVVFYATVCLAFAVMYWLVFSNVLWSSRAMKTQAELNVASTIQKDMLPCIFPPFPERNEFDIFATMQPAKEVGGDFYDFFLIDENHLAVVIADVSGKGVPAALFMVIAKTLIKNHAQAGDSPADTFTNTNRQLCENNEAGMFVTAWMGVLEIDSGRFIYVNAGHNPPLVKKANGEYTYLKSRAGFVLAGMDDMQYRQQEMQLEKGDTLYLYTDGVTEATDTKNELYGEPRLQEILNQNASMPVSALLPAVKADIDVFVKGAPQFDDITMLALKIKEENA